MIEHRLVPTPTSTRLLTLLTERPPAPPWIPGRLRLLPAAQRAQR